MKRRRLIIILLALLMVGDSLFSSWPASAVAQGDGALLYAEGTVQTTRYRQKTGTSYGAESSLPTSGAAIRYIRTKAAPTRDEIIAGTVNTSGVLNIFRWNGTSWSSEWSVTIGLGNLPRFDIAYEQSSGKALVAYSRNVGTTDEIAYRSYNGSTWTSATNLDAVRTTGVVQYLRLEARSGTNEIAMAWGDANFTLSANYWNGTGGTWVGEPASTIASGLTITSGNAALSSRIFDLAFESVSGELLIVWGVDADADAHHITRTAGTGGSWGSPTTTTAFTKQLQDIQLASDPGSDNIALANICDWNGTASGAYAEAAIWSGSGWGSINSYDTSTSTVAISLVRTSVEWVVSGGQTRAVVVYDDSASSGVDWLFFNKNTSAWSAVQSDYTGAPAPSSSGAAGAMYLYRNPFNSGMLTYITIDGANDLFTKQLVFDGTNFTWSSQEPSGASPETSIASKTGWNAAFVYNAYVPGGTLSTDIVDSGGSSVASPSVSLSGLAASSNCQTSTGTFGQSSQKIRVTNTTAAAPWTLSVAATGGATANWSSGTATYDFNDSTGTGCSDGGDADSLAGQLSVDASAGTLAPQSGCSNTGVSLGAASAFSQGTTDSITLASASGSAATNCYWELTGVGLSQKIPSLQPSGTYSLQMTLTVVAN